jgi:hypothetical protein
MGVKPHGDDSDNPNDFVIRYIRNHLCNPLKKINELEKKLGRVLQFWHRTS